MPVGLELGRRLRRFSTRRRRPRAGRRPRRAPGCPRAPRGRRRRREGGSCRGQRDRDAEPDQDQADPGREREVNDIRPGQEPEDARADDHRAEARSGRSSSPADDDRDADAMSAIGHVYCQDRIGPELVEQEEEAEHDEQIPRRTAPLAALDLVRAAGIVLTRRLRRAGALLGNGDPADAVQEDPDRRRRRRARPPRCGRAPGRRRGTCRGRRRRPR